MVVGCYANAEFLGLWGHENPQDPIYDSIRAEFVVNFSKLSSIIGIKATERYLSIYYTF